MKINREIKFTALISVLFLIPFLITVFQFRSNNRHFQKMYTSSYLEMRTQSAARLVSDVLGANYNFSELVNSDEFKKKGTAVFSSLLNKMPAPYYDAALLDNKGHEIYRHSSGRKMDYSYKDSEAVKSAMETGISAGNVEYDRYLPPVFVIAEPLPGNKGYAAARFSLAYIGSLVRRLGKNSYGNMGIMDAGGRVIADSLGVSVVSPGMLAPEELLYSLENARSEDISSLVHEVKASKLDYLIAISNIDGTDWWFYEVLDTRFMPLSQDGIKLKYTVFFGTILIIICSFTTCLLAKNMFQD